MPIVFKNSLCKIEKQKSEEFQLTLDGEKNKKYLELIKKNLIKLGCATHLFNRSNFNSGLVELNQ